MRTSSTQPPLGLPLNRSHSLCPYGAWPMNEGGGQKFFDGTGKTNLPGALSGGAVFQKSAKGSCTFYDGVNDFGKITNLDLTGTNRIAVSVWVKFTQSSVATIFEDSIDVNSNQQAFALFINGHAAGDFYFDCSDTAFFNIVYTTTKSYNDGKWHHVVVTADRQLTGTAQTFIYVDGVKDTTQDPGNSHNQTANFKKYDLYLGSRAGSSVFYSGLLTNLMIWATALSLTEVRQLYTNPYSMYIGNQKLL